VVSFGNADAVAQARRGRGRRDLLASPVSSGSASQGGDCGAAG
jgi:hypothetical protein